MAKRICCPNILCKSTDVVPVSTKTKFSLRKVWKNEIYMPRLRESA